MSTPTFKVVLVGDGGCGKSSMLSVMTGKELPQKYDATFGVEVRPLDFHTSEGDVQLHVWDTAGQEKFGGLRDGYYIGGQGAIIMCDVTSPHTIQNVRRWRRDVKRVCENVPILVVANKIDLNDTEGVKLPEDCYEVSVKDTTGLDEVFESIIRRMMGKPTMTVDPVFESKREAPQPPVLAPPGQEQTPPRPKGPVFGDKSQLASSAQPLSAGWLSCTAFGGRSTIPTTSFKTLAEAANPLPKRSVTSVPTLEQFMDEHSLALGQHVDVNKVHSVVLNAAFKCYLCTKDLNDFINSLVIAASPAGGVTSLPRW